MWTKRQLCNEALGELAIQGYEFDIRPEELASAVRRLDTLMATWESKGIQLGYAFPASLDESDPDTLSGVPDYAVEAVYLNLAIRLAPGYGKQVSPDTKKAAGEAYMQLLWSAASPLQQPQPNTLPRGAGNKPWTIQRQPFLPGESTDQLPAECGGSSLNVWLQQLLDGVELPALLINTSQRGIRLSACGL